MSPTHKSSASCHVHQRDNHKYQHHTKGETRELLSTHTVDSYNNMQPFQVVSSSQVVSSYIHHMFTRGCSTVLEESVIFSYMVCNVCVTSNDKNYLPADRYCLSQTILVCTYRNKLLPRLDLYAINSNWRHQQIGTIQLSISIVMHGFGTRSIDSHCWHQQIRTDIDRCIWSATNDFSVSPQQTTALTKGWEIGPSVDIADYKRKRNLVIDGHYGRQQWHLLQQQFYCYCNICRFLSRNHMSPLICLLSRKGQIHHRNHIKVQE